MFLHFSGVLISCFRYPSASKANSLPAVVPRMRQWRAGRKFPCVTGGLDTIFDLVENDPNWKKIKCSDNGFMAFKSINHKAAVRGIVFGDVEFTASIDAALHQTVFVEEAPITISGLKESRLIIATVPHKNYVRNHLTEKKLSPYFTYLCNFIFYL